MAEAGLRSRYGVSVLAVKRLTRDGLERRFVPEPADRFEHGDVARRPRQRGGRSRASASPRAAGAERRTPVPCGAILEWHPGHGPSGPDGQGEAERARRPSRQVVQGAHAALRPRDGPAHRRRPRRRPRQAARGARLASPSWSSARAPRAHVEEVWGWEAYDDLLLDFVRRLKAFQTDGIVPGGTFCLPYVRSDEIILFINPDGGGLLDGSGRARAEGGRARPADPRLPRRARGRLGALPLLRRARRAS